jgi:hypothetical protein
MVHTNFLTLEYLKEQTPISSALGNQVELLEPFISVAENMHLDVLGTALKDSLITMIENQTLTGVSETLVDDYIIPYSAWITFWEASLFIMYRAEAKGITKKFSDNSQALDKTEFALFRQGIKDKADFYHNRLLDYLTSNQSAFPLWRCTDTNPINKKESYSGGIYLG